WERTPRSWQRVVGAEPRFRFEPAGATVSVLRDSPGDIQLRIVSQQPGEFVIAESFHGGWRASVDGTIVPIVQTTNGFMQIPFAAGDHALQLRFQPESLKYGRWMSFAGLGLTLGWVVLGGFLPSFGRGLN